MKRALISIAAIATSALVIPLFAQPSDLPARGTGTCAFGQTQGASQGTSDPFQQTATQFQANRQGRGRMQTSFTDSVGRRRAIQQTSPLCVQRQQGRGQSRGMGRMQPQGMQRAGGQRQRGGGSGQLQGQQRCRNRQRQSVCCFSAGRGNGYCR